MRRYSIVIILAFDLAVPVLAYADSITTLPEYNSSTRSVDPGPFAPTAVVGSFIIASGDTAITISGTFGNSLTHTTAGVDLYLGSILVAQCVEPEPCYMDDTKRKSWSATLTPAEIALLGTGIVDFTVTQTSQYYVRLGETTLTQVNTATAPEPTSLLLLGTGALGIAGVFRRRLLR